MGAWRTLRTANGERAVDVAKLKGHNHLLQALEPVYKRTVPNTDLHAIQVNFHTLIRERAHGLVEEHNLRLPELEPLLEYDSAEFWFPVPGMYGGFAYALLTRMPEPRLVVKSWCRVVGGSGQHHDITPTATTLLDAGMV
jgi:hypothetical protein